MVKVEQLELDKATVEQLLESETNILQRNVQTQKEEADVKARKAEQLLSQVRGLEDDKARLLGELEAANVFVNDILF